MYKVDDILVMNNSFITIIKITDRNIVTRDKDRNRTCWTVDGFSNLLKRGYKIYTPQN